MSTSTRRSLGEQALYVIREAGERCAEIDKHTAEIERNTTGVTGDTGDTSSSAHHQVDREALRAKIDLASARPLPGTSHLLSENRPLAEEYHGVDRQGKPGKIKVYDLVGAAPVLWCRKGVEKRKVPKEKVQ